MLTMIFQLKYMIKWWIGINSSLTLGCKLLQEQKKILDPFIFYFYIFFAFLLLFFYYFISIRLFAFVDSCVSVCRLLDRPSQSPGPRARTNQTKSSKVPSRFVGDSVTSLRFPRFVDVFGDRDVVNGSTSTTGRIIRDHSHSYLLIRRHPRNVFFFYFIFTNDLFFYFVHENSFIRIFFKDGQRIGHRREIFHFIFFKIFLKFKLGFGKCLKSLSQVKLAFHLWICP